MDRTAAAWLFLRPRSPHVLFSTTFHSSGAIIRLPLCIIHGRYQKRSYLNGFIENRWCSRWVSPIRNVIGRTDSWGWGWEGEGGREALLPRYVRALESSVRI